MNEARKKLRFITQVLYALKRDFGGMIDLYSPTSVVTDLETGSISRTTTRQRIKRAIILESKALERHIYGLTFIAANKNFSYGANFEENSRVFILDGKDVSSVSLDQYIVYAERRYEIKFIQEFEFNRGFLVTAVELKGALPRQVIELSAMSSISFGMEVNHEF